jgi:hypothetical protein
MFILFFLLLLLFLNFEFRLFLPLRPFLVKLSIELVFIGGFELNGIIPVGILEINEFGIIFEVLSIFKFFII